MNANSKVYAEYKRIPDADKAMEFFVASVIKNDNILRRALGSSFHEYVRHVCESAFRDIVSEAIEERCRDLAVKPSDVKILADFYTHGLIGILIQHCGNKELDAAAFSRQVKRLIDSGITFLTN